MILFCRILYLHCVKFSSEYASGVRGRNRDKLHDFCPTVAHARPLPSHLDRGRRDLTAIHVENASSPSLQKAPLVTGSEHRRWVGFFGLRPASNTFDARLFWRQTIREQAEQVPLESLNSIAHES